jgi:hypothetical protein
VKACFTLAVIAAVALPALADQPKPATDDVQDFVIFAESRPLLVRAHVRVDGKSYRAVWDEYVDRVFKFLEPVMHFEIPVDRGARR